MKNTVKKIHNKIAVVFIIVIAFVLFGTFLVLNHTFQQEGYQTIRKDLYRKVSLAKTFVERMPLKTNPQWIADQISRDLQLRVTIIDGEGQVLADSGVEQPAELENHLYRPEIQEAVEAGYGESRRFSTSKQEDFLYIAAKYEDGGAKGFVRLALPLRETNLVARKVNYFLGLSFLPAFLLAVVAAYLASVWISRPIKKIAWSARRIAAGNFDSRIFAARKDEIGDLASAFNEMAGQVRERISEVALGKSQLEAVFLSMSEGVLVLDEHGKIFLMNQALRRLLNITEDPIGKRPLEAIRNVSIQEMIVEVQKNGKVASEGIEFLVPEQRLMQVQAAPIKREGKISGVVLVFHDITELRRLENIRKEFVSNVSHELRTPVASIKGYAETLVDGALNDKENAGDFIRIILANAERLAKLIEDLLDLSALESGRMSRDFAACSLKTILKRVLENVRALARVQKIDISVEGLEDDIFVKGDEMGLFRLFLNLTENAVKYNKEQGRVDIIIKSLGEMVEIKVRDTGIGIPEKDIPRVFERFYRVDKAHSRQVGGTGLGLSIVKHLVQVHHGTVFLESVLDEGSCFTVQLPSA
ncbi:MAG: two-component system histidine kinase PnpS [Candidatus Omnitrophota bacterium]